MPLLSNNWPVSATLQGLRASSEDSAPSPEVGNASMASHLRNLTEEEQSKLLNFKELCEKGGYYRFPDKGHVATHDDGTLLRFLRAREFNIMKAFDQFSFVEDWRTEHSMREFYCHMDVDKYEESRQMFAQWTGRRDYQGHPVYVFPIKHFTRERADAYVSKFATSNTGGMRQTTKLPGHILYFHALYENLLEFVMPLCTQLPRPNTEASVSASTHIIDITDVDFAHFWKIKRYLQGASSLATTYYPETLSHIFIVGARPSFIRAWTMVKKWFDPNSLAKIFILSPHDATATLLTYMEDSSLPEQYGGTLRWEWGDMPDLDEPARLITSGLYQSDENGHECFVKGPVAFSNSKVQVLGTVKGRPRKDTTCDLHNVDQDYRGKCNSTEYSWDEYM